MSNPPASPSQYLSIPPFPWASLQCNLPPPLCHSPRPCSIIFRMTKKYMTIKNPRCLWERGAGPEVTPAILASLCPTFHPSPLIALSHGGGCHSPLALPPHSRYCLNPPCCPAHFIQSLCGTNTHTHTHRHTHMHTHAHTQAKEFLIITSEWHDWIRSRGETEEKQKQQSWEMENGGGSVKGWRDLTTLLLSHLQILSLSV